MLNAQIIQPSCRPWGFPVVVRRTKDGDPRIYINYRAMNKRLKADKFAIHNIEKILDSMRGGTVCTKLEISTGYWQIKLAEHIKNDSF